MSQSSFPANWTSVSARRNRRFPKILLPLGIIVVGLVAVFFAIARHGRAALLEALPMYLVFAVPHFASLIALVRLTPSRAAVFGGFLSGFWGTIFLYLNFAGLFLFSQPYSSGWQGIEWFVAQAFGVWVIVAGLQSFKVNKPGYWLGFVAGLICPYAAMVFLALSQRGH
jgi:hypothetical protein